MRNGHGTSRSCRRALVLVGALIVAVAPGPHVAAQTTGASTATAGVGESFAGTGGFVQTTFHPSAVDALRATARSADGFPLWAGTAGGDFGLADEHSYTLRITADFGGTYDIANAVAGLPDMSILTAGAAGDNLAVAKFSRAALDPTFATDGRLVVDLGGSDDAAYGVVVQSSGAIVVAGGNAGRIVLLRYRPDGTPDPSFGSGGQVVSTTTGAARALVAQPDGKLLAVSADATRFWVSRYSADGQPDPTFGTSGRASATVGQGALATALALQGDGKIVVAGGRSGDVALARFTAGGTLDPTFGTLGVVVDDLGRTETAYGMAALSSGALVVVGEVDAHHGFHTVYSGTGHRDPSIGGPNWTIALRSVGPVWLDELGVYGTNADDDFAMYRLGEDGRLLGNNAASLDFGRPAQAPTDVAVQADGRIVVMGTSNNAAALVRYNTDGTRDPSFGIGGLVRNDLAAVPYSLVIQGNGRIVMTGLAPTDPSEIILLGFQPDGRIDPTFGTRGRSVVRRGGRGSGNALVSLPDGKLLVGGGDNGQSFLARFLPDGAVDTAFGTNGVILDRFPATGNSAQGMTVHHLAVQPDGKVLAVDSDGVVHRFDADGVVDPTWGGDGSVLTGPWFMGRVEALAIQPDGRILLGGSVYSAGTHRGQILRYNADGSKDATWTAAPVVFDNASFTGGVVRFRALAIQPDGKILATGAGPTLPLARYLPDGTLDASFHDGGKLLEPRAGNDAVGAVIVAGSQLLVASTDQSGTGFMFSRFFIGTPVAGIFHSLPPARLLDTRAGAPVAAGGTIAPTVTGVGGVPATGVSAVVLNVTVTQPTAQSFLTVYPNGTPRPLASNLNFVAGQTVPNLVVAKVGADGKVAVYNNAGSTHVILDVVGWYSSDGAASGGGRYNALPPSRLLDTRTGAPVAAGGTIAPTVTSAGGVPATGVSAVVLNVTVTQPTAETFLTVYPNGTARPLASNLNVVRNQTVPNLVVAKVGADGKVAVYNNAGSAHVILDVVGWFGTEGAIGSGGSYNALPPSRLLDTRTGAPVAAGGTIAPTVTGAGGVPATGVSAVVLNVTVTQPTAESFLTVYPNGTGRPLASNLNFVPSQTVPNLVVAKVGADGKVAVYNNAGSAHVVLDVVGWYSA